MGIDGDVHFQIDGTIGVRVDEGVTFGRCYRVERGVTFLNEPRCVDGVSWAADFSDPDGHVLSIFGPEG